MLKRSFIFEFDEIINFMLSGDAISNDTFETKKADFDETKLRFDKISLSLVQDSDGDDCEIELVDDFKFVVESKVVRCLSLDPGVRVGDVKTSESKETI